MFSRRLRPVGEEPRVVRKALSAMARSWRSELQSSAKASSQKHAGNSVPGGRVRGLSALARLVFFTLFSLEQVRRSVGSRQVRQAPERVGRVASSQARSGGSFRVLARLAVLDDGRWLLRDHRRRGRRGPQERPSAPCGRALGSRRGHRRESCLTPMPQQSLLQPRPHTNGDAARKHGPHSPEATASGPRALSHMRAGLAGGAELESSDASGQSKVRYVG